MPWVRLSTIIPFDSDSRLDMFTIRRQGLVASVNQSTRLSANLSELDEEYNTAISQVRTIQLCTWPEQMFNLTRILCITMALKLSSHCSVPLLNIRLCSAHEQKNEMAMLLDCTCLASLSHSAASLMIDCNWGHRQLVLSMGEFCQDCSNGCLSCVPSTISISSSRAIQHVGGTYICSCV